jgi:tetrahydromethanopterin S-methyltransferase subunit G
MATSLQRSPTTRKKSATKPKGTRITPIRTNQQSSDDSNIVPIWFLQFADTEFNKLKERVGIIETRLDRVETRLGVLDRHVGDIEIRLDNIGTWLNQVETRLGNVETQLCLVRTQIDGIETQIVRVETRIDQIETRLDFVETRLDRVETEVVTLRREYGNLGNRIGELSELVMGLDVLSIFEDLNYNFDDDDEVIERRVKCYTKDGYDAGDIDILIHDKDRYIAIEVKTNFRRSLIDKVVLRLPVLREKLIEEGKKVKSLVGAIAFVRGRGNPAKIIREAGFYPIQCKRTDAEIVATKNFKPKEF